MLSATVNLIPHSPALLQHIKEGLSRESLTSDFDSIQQLHVLTADLDSIQLTKVYRSLPIGYQHHSITVGKSQLNSLHLHKL